MNRLTFFLGTMSEGGAERVVSYLANGFCKKYSVTIVTFYKDEVFYELNQSIRVICIEDITGSKSRIKNFFWLHHYLKKNSDLLISFLAPFNMFAIMSSWFTKVPVIVADRNDPHKVPHNSIARFLRNWLYSFSNHLVVQTTDNYNYFPRRIQRKCSVIYNPISLGQAVGKALLSSCEPVIVSVGRLVPQKNFHLLIRAFSIVHKYHSNYRLLILGEGPERGRLEELIKQKGLSEWVYLPGKTKTVFDQLSKSELFVLSSYYEGMPNALIEAMCVGLPVIATRVSGVSDLIQNHVNGMIVDIDDVEGLSQAILFLIEHKNEARQMAENAVMLNETLSIDSILKQWESILTWKYENGDNHGFKRV